MIKVVIEESGVNFSKEIGTMTPLQIEDLIRIVKDHGTLYDNEKYVYVDSYYDINYGGYLIIVDISD